MFILNRDGSLDDEPQTTSSAERMAWRLYAEIPARPLDEQSHWIERLIRIAFERLGLDSLGIRVLPDGSKAGRAGQPTDRL